MKALFACDGTKELEISGTAVEWEAFSLAILHHGIEIPCEHVDDATPYSMSLQRIVVLHSPGQAVEFQVNDETDLLLIGDQQLLDRLAATAGNFGRDFEDGSHIHIDYQGEGHFVGRNTIPAVFARN